MAGIEAARLYVGIDANTTGLTTGLRAAETQTQRFFGGMQNMSRKMSSVGNRLTVGLTLPIVGFAAASVAAYEEHDRALRQTQAVLKSTQGVAGVTMRALDDLTQSVAKQAAVDDDLIRQGANLLLTFTNVRNGAGKNNDIFNQTVSVMTDVAAAMAAASGGQMDLKSTAIQLGKALNDPVKGISALTRIGVTFTDAQKEMIKQLVAGGDTMGAQKIILQELKREFHGSAKANATDTQKLKVAFDDLRESVGKLLMPYIQQLAEYAKKLLHWFDQLSPSAKKLAVKIGLMLAVVGPLMKLLSGPVGVIAWWGKLATKILSAATAAQTLAAAQGAASAAGTAGSAATAATGAAGAASVAGPLAILIGSLVAVAATIGYVNHQANAARDGLRNFNGSIEDWIKSRNTGDFNLANNSISTSKALDKYRHEQEMLVRTLDFSNTGIEHWTKSILKANGLTKNESEKIAGRIRLIEAFGGSLDDATRKQVENMLAVGDVKRAMQILKGTLDPLREAARRAAEWLLVASNSARNFANSVPSGSPGGGRRIKPPPALATGGIVRQATTAIVGEAGPEAVIPLSQLDRMMGGQNLTVNVRLDRKRFNRDYDYAARVRGL